MGNLPVIKKFPVFPAHGGVYVKILALSAKKRHHLVGDVKKIVHGHLRKIIQNLIFRVFLLIISRRPVGDRLNGRDKERDDQPERGKDPGGVGNGLCCFCHFVVLRLITFSLVNSSRSFSSRALVMSFTSAWYDGIVMFFSALARFWVFLMLSARR